MRLLKKCPYPELFWFAFSRIRTEYGEILRTSPYSVQMRKITDQYNSEYGHFLRSVWEGHFQNLFVYNFKNAQVAKVLRQYLVKLYFLNKYSVFSSYNFQLYTLFIGTTSYIFLFPHEPH